MLAWSHSLEKLNKFFGFMSGIDTTGKIKVTMSVTNKSVLEFLDLSLLINKQS